MLDKDRIFRHFRTMSGLDSPAATPFRALCDSAGLYIFGRLREGAETDRHMDRLCFAAAALAYADWLEIGGGSTGAQEIRIGDIALREGSSGRRALDSAAKRDHFLAGIADLLAPPFVLAGMPGQAGEGER